MLEEFFIPEIYLPILYIAVSFLVYNITKRLINTFLKSKQANLKEETFNYKKIETFKSLLENLCKYTLIIFLTLSILSVYGVDVSGVLAGLGIAGLIIGLSLQDLIRDIIAGITIIIENQYAVGDTIEIRGFKGEVEFLGLKTTRIRNSKGELFMIANRNIPEMINYSIPPLKKKKDK